MAAMTSVRKLPCYALLLLAGCAVPEAPEVPQNLPASLDAPTRPAAALDGWYEGRQVSVDQTAACKAQDRKVWFKVAGPVIEMYASRHRRSAVRRILLDGSVAADGRLVLRPQSLDRSASGSIRGDVLTAADLPVQMDRAVHRRSCLHQYEATRKRDE